MSNSDETNAACCAAFYEQDWVHQVLGESFHPGGKELSFRLLQSLRLSPDARVLDAACGIGTTTRMMLDQFGLEPIGVDFSRDNIDKAIRATQGSNKPIQFVIGPVDSLPFSNDSFDAVVCECAVSTFANQPTVLAEFLRIIKPGGLLAVSDMVVEGELPDDVATHIAPWTCLSEAHSVRGYQQLFLDAGFLITQYADESSALVQLISELKRKLLAAGLGKALGAVNGANMDLADARRVLASAKDLTEQGVVQYCRMVLSKGTPRYCAPPAELPVIENACGCDDGKCC